MSLCLPIRGHARELVDMTVDITSDKKGADAKQEAFDAAVEQASRKLTEDMVGTEKADKVWPHIRARLLKESTRYVVFIKGSTPVEDKGQSRIQVQMRISPDHLEGFLREMNVLGGGSVRVLPLVGFSDFRGSRYAWWADLSDEKANSYALQDFKLFMKQLTAHFKNKNVFVLDPTNASFRMSVPSAYRSAALRREDQVLLGQYMKADVVISGSVRVTKPRSDSGEQSAEYQLEMWQTKTGSSLSDVSVAQSVVSDTPKAAYALLQQSNPKVIDSLSGKLTEAVASGTLNLSTLRLSVEGNLNYQQMTDLKRQLGSVREIRQIRERLFEPSRVTFEVETSVNGMDLAKSLEKARFDKFVVRVQDSQDDGLVLAVRSTSPTSAQ